MEWRYRFVALWNSNLACRNVFVVGNALVTKRTGCSTRDKEIRALVSVVAPDNSGVELLKDI